MRETCVDAVGKLASSIATQQPAAFGSDTSSNLVLKLVIELLADQKKETQAAACQALFKVRS